MQAAQNGPLGCEVVHIEGQHHGFTLRPDLDEPVGPTPGLVACSTCSTSRPLCQKNPANRLLCTYVVA